MFADAILMDFHKRRFGWLSPSGELIVCDMYSHIKALGKQERYDDLYQQAKEDMDDDLASLDPDEHPAMHRFDCEGDATQGVMDEAYEEGWVRFGVWDGPNKQMEAISTISTLTKQIERIKFIADVLGYELHVRDQRNCKIAIGARRKMGLG